MDIDKAIDKIKDTGADEVLLQLPEGLKPMAMNLADEIERKTDARIFIWAGTCYGACDIPNVDVDLLIHIGHTPLEN